MVHDVFLLRGLDKGTIILIMSKLDETAKTEAVLDILAMNVSRRLAQWLARFFRFCWILGGNVVFQ